MSHTFGVNVAVTIGSGEGCVWARHERVGT
jgi:hypothetical protein